MRVLLKGPLGPFSGYGNSGLGLAKALVKMGVDLYLQPTACAPPLPRWTAMLLTREVVGPFDLVINLTSPAGLGLSPSLERSTEFSVGWTMWEWTTLDDCEGVETFKRRTSDFDLVLGYDDVSVGALERHAGAMVRKLQGGFDPEGWRYVERDWNGPLRFGMAGALSPRKGPFQAIEAFKRAREKRPDLLQGAELWLKTSSPNLHPSIPEVFENVRVFSEVWRPEKMAWFYSQVNVLLAPSKGEGLNLPALEFMTTGGPVIATDWGGHHEWMSNAVAYPLRYQLGAFGQALQAYPDEDHLEELILHVAEHPHEAREKGRIASGAIPSSMNWDVVLDRFFNLLAEVNEAGRLVRSKAKTCRPRTEMELVSG